MPGRSARREGAIDVARTSGCRGALRSSSACCATCSTTPSPTRPTATAIELEVAEVGHEVRIAVADEGPGVPQEDRERIFEPFFRGSHERAAGQGGVGLGLAIVREIVHAHGGTITLADRPDGPGARFEVRLPRVT